MICPPSATAYTSTLSSIRIQTAFCFCRRIANERVLSMEATDCRVHAHTYCKTCTLDCVSR